MKRWIALLLAGILLFGTAAAEFEVVTDEKEQTAETDMEFQDETELDEEDAEDVTGDSDLDVWLNWVNPYPDRNYEELVVGNPTPMDGKFFTGMWGNATSDIDVRSLVHGYYLTMWGYETGLFVHTPNVVSGMLIAEDPEGNRTYTLSLCDRIMGPFSSYSRWASFIGEVPLCFLESKDQAFTEASFSKIVDFFHFEDGREIYDW